MRQEGTIRIASQGDRIRKNQNVKTLDEKPFVYSDSSRIDLSNINFFYGGKGNGYTSEISADFTMGEKKTSLTDNTKTVSKYESTTSSKYFEYSFGTSNKLGLGFIFADYKNDMFSNGSINGMAFNNNKTIKSRVSGGRIGKAFGSSMFSLGLTLEVDNFSTKMNLPLVSNVQKVAGIAIGGGGQNTHVEITLEADLLEKGKNAAGEETTMPTKFSLVLETRFGHATFGYKGVAYRGSFIDIDKLVQSQLIYVNQNKSTRLEHTFNFSLNGSKGCFIGAMAMFSNSNAEEFSSVFTSKETHQTKTRSFSLAAKIGYSW
jgi:hypothetical protein